MSFFRPVSSDVDFKGSTLILPVVSLASVPSLASDLLIETLRLKHVGTFTSRYHAPILGARDGQRPSLSGLSTPVELFQSIDGKLSLLHQRSSPLRIHKDAFVDALRNWISQSGLKTVLIISSNDAARRPMTSAPSSLRYLGNEGGLAKRIAELAPSLGTEPLNSAGLTRRLYIALEGTQLDVAALLIYVVEGDNEGDAKALADAVVRVLPEAAALRGEGDWIKPRSWNVGLFGKATNPELYG